MWTKGFLILRHLRTQALGMYCFDIPMSETSEVNTSVRWVTRSRVLETLLSRWNPPSVIEYIPLSRLAVWLRESVQLLVRVEANQKSCLVVYQGSDVSNWLTDRISSSLTDISVEGYSRRITFQD